MQHSSNMHKYQVKSSNGRTSNGACRTADEDTLFHRIDPISPNNIERMHIILTIADD